MRTIPADLKHHQPNSNQFQFKSIKKQHQFQ